MHGILPGVTPPHRNGRHGPFGMLQVPPFTVWVGLCSKQWFRSNLCVTPKPKEPKKGALDRVSPRIRLEQERGGYRILTGPGGRTPYLPMPAVATSASRGAGVVDSTGLPFQRGKSVPGVDVQFAIAFHGAFGDTDDAQGARAGPFEAEVRAVDPGQQIHVILHETPIGPTHFDTGLLGVARLAAPRPALPRCGQGRLVLGRDDKAPQDGREWDGGGGSNKRPDPPIDPGRRHLEIFPLPREAIFPQCRYNG